MSPPAPLLLALDTSTSTASVALFYAGHVLSETTWLAGREHSTRLLVEVDIAFERIGRTPTELTGLVVARGPGSFTGVRVALSVAKGMAAGLNIPLWGVSSLDVLAHAAGPIDVPVRALIEAGRERYATAAYEHGRSIDAARLATLAQIEEMIGAPTLVIGDLSDAARTQLEGHAHARLASAAACLRRAGYLAELGWRHALSGDPGDAHLVDALYVG